MLFCAPTEIRTPVLALKGLRPGPLDDGGNGQNSIILRQMGQEECIIRYEQLPLDGTRTGEK
jgi:hypothetical protein